MKTMTTDIVVIGGGPGGTPLAMGAAKAGRQVVLVEAGAGLGGTCLFHGCIPSKIFREAAILRYHVERAARLGIGGGLGDPTVDWPTIEKRRETILAKRSGAALANARKIPSLSVLFGKARFLDSHRIVVEGPEGPTEVGFERAVIATGSVSRKLELPGADGHGILSSERLISTDRVPSRMAVIGGGPIGVEMAQIFSLLGTKVTILEALPSILTPVDRTLAQRLQLLLEQDGIPVHTGVKIDRFEPSGTGQKVHYSVGGAARTLEADIVLTVVGRLPNIEGLGLDNTKVQYSSKGIQVDGRLRTAEPHIWASGDVVGQPMFAHWATAQAQALTADLLGRPASFPAVEHNSAVIFSHPELGMAGLTEEGARERGWDVRVAEYNYAIDARAQIADEAEGLLRIVYRSDDATIVGVHALIEGAADLMGEAALAVATGAKLGDFARTIHPHPTLTESFGICASAALGGRS